MGHVNINEFIQRVKVNLTTKNARLIRKIIIEKVVGFPPSLEALELIMASRHEYQSDTRTIVDRDGNILTDMSAEGITKTFHIPTFQEMETPTIEECQATWDGNPTGCKRSINQHWLKEKQGRAVKVPHELFRSDFHEDYHELVTMLSRVMGLLTTAFFQEWMVYFIEKILWGNDDVTTKTTFDWGGIISNYFHEVFLNVKKRSKFYMTSYLVYSLADQRKYNGLFVAPDQEQG